MLNLPVNRDSNSAILRAMSALGDLTRADGHSWGCYNGPKIPGGEGCTAACQRIAALCRDRHYWSKPGGNTVRQDLQELQDRIEVLEGEHNR